MERTEAKSSDHASERLDARGAAEYLGVHRDTLRKLAAQRAIPTHQDGPGCNLYSAGMSSTSGAGQPGPCARPPG